ncbi:Helicase C 2 and DEAD 2 domain containing protein [Trichuris trichiura]|uniref:Helicase C 2 and DEAD 2 domain containing protein n=1 Tax=Trichuris trichiura TaxID=36087 RepID=A0A077Z9S7_TRITR|nr:Helicase C 2 and DEAD 2 domain containing protein [Trichuris trichiura]
MTDFDDDKEFEQFLNEHEELKRMCDAGVACSLPEEFGCLIEPYENQKMFMRTLYATLLKGNVAIMESPTGTGKSLSLLCGSLTWLRDARRQIELDLQCAIEKNKKIIQQPSGSNWLEEHAEKDQAKIVVEQSTDRLNKIRLARKRLDQVKTDLNVYKNASLKRKKTVLSVCLSDQSECENDSDDILLNDDLDKNEVPVAMLEDETSDVYRVTPQIFYSSRTHSQLAQFAKEIKKTAYADSTHVVTIASRQSLCINDSVLRLKNPVLMNEKCLLLQNYSSKKHKDAGDSSSRCKSRCPFLRQEGVKQLAEESLCIGDIEEIVNRGKEIQACPYYATRDAVNLADLILMPYQVLMQKDTRKIFGLSLTDNVVIVDEAHNLLETVESIHGFEISSGQLSQAKIALCSYLSKFRSRFSAKILMHVQQLQSLVDLSTKCLLSDGELPFAQTSVRCFGMSDFIAHVGIEAINCFVLANFMDETNLCRKMRGFLKSIQLDGTEVTENVFYAIRSYIGCLTNRVGDGRFLIDKRPKTESGKIIKFILLNPAVCIDDVLKEARAVVLTGGTMEPVRELYDRLFIPLGVPMSRITHLSCSHVVPDSSILPLVITNGPLGHKMEFTYSSRCAPQLLDDLCKLLLRLSGIVPGGIVCFFSSYEYEQIVSERLKTSGILDQLQTHKQLFREPRKANEINELLLNYGDAISSSNGAILFAVVGGKMSEGINFSDNLCRCVVIIGMPYPNRFSLELQEKMNYLNSLFNSGQEYYEDLCFKAINQSVGRAIRHSKDFASLVFLDCRYSNKAYWKKLPSWLEHLICIPASFSEACTALVNFYAAFNKH